MNLTLYGAETTAVIVAAAVAVVLFLVVTGVAWRGHKKLSACEQREQAQADELVQNAAKTVCYLGLPNLSTLSALASQDVGAAAESSAPLLAALHADSGRQGTSVGTEAAAQHAEKKRETHGRRRRLRLGLLILLAVGVVAGIAVGLYFLINETVKRPGTEGYEATERYHGIIECAGSGVMVSRMRVFSYGKFLPVIRFSGDENAYVYKSWYPMGFNPGIFCYRDEVYLIGSASSELHMAGGPPPGQVRIMNIKTQKMFMPKMQYDSCVDEYFQQCSMDGKWSVVAEANGTLRGYIRANAWSTGGGRWAQTATSVDGGRSWSAFQLVQIDGVTIQKNVNVYTFLVVRANATHLRARYPAVTPSGAGIWEAFSADGVRFAAPVLLRAGHPHGPRVDLQPVEHTATGVVLASRINLHVSVNTVSLYQVEPDGSLVVDERFKTERFVWM